MVLAGHVQDYPLAELLFFLSSKQRTGQLILKRPDFRIIFTLRRGRLIAAQMIPADQRLGDRLIADGDITAAVLRDALQDQQRGSDRPLGTILVDRGDVQPQTVINALRAQITDCLVSFLIAPGGTFMFHEKQIDTDRIEVDVIIEREVLEAIRRADEYVARQIDTGPLRLKPNVDADALQPFVLENWDLIDALIGGAQTVDAIIAETSWDRERVVNTLFQLQANGAIDLEFTLGTPISAIVPDPTRELEEANVA
jgi:hypothetical protein